MLYVVNLYDSGKFIVTDLLKNNTDIKNNFKYLILNSYLPINRVLSNEVILPIFVFRDIRVCWLISEYKKEGFKRTRNMEQYIKCFNDVLTIYLEIKNEKHCLSFRFEDFLLNKNREHKKLCDNLGISYDPLDFPNYFRGKTTLFSVRDIEKILKFQKYVDDDQLSFISSKTKFYNEFFKYPQNLSKNDILQGLSM